MFMFRWEGVTFAAAGMQAIWILYLEMWAVTLAILAVVAFLAKQPDY